MCVKPSLFSDQFSSHFASEREFVLRFEVEMVMGRFFSRLAIISMLLVCVVAVESEKSAAEAIVAGLRFRTSRPTSIQSASDIHFGSKLDGADSELQDSKTGGEKWNAAKTIHSIRWEGNKVRRRLLQVLARRRKKPVNPPQILPGLHHNESFIQGATFISSSEFGVKTDHPAGNTLTVWDCHYLAGDFLHTLPHDLVSSPKAQAPQEFEAENLILWVEEGEQGKVPLLIIRPKSSNKEVKRPAIIALHGTNHSKETMRPLMEDYASAGFVAVAVDARYHGDRASSPDAYSDALLDAWETGKTMPFVFDTVWDLIKVVDYLTERPDIDPLRIGMMGISLGGMHTWFAAAADPRIAAAVPLIGVQSFGWAVAHNKWQARVATILPPFTAAAHFFRKTKVDSEVVAAVWRRIAPGIMDELDAQYTVPIIAPRPLLVYNGFLDPRCPIKGLMKVRRKIAEEYKEAGVPNNYKFMAQQVAHVATVQMTDATKTWFEKFLL